MCNCLFRENRDIRDIDNIIIKSAHTYIHKAIHHCPRRENDMKKSGSSTHITRANL